MFFSNASIIKIILFVCCSSLLLLEILNFNFYVLLKSITPASSVHLYTEPFRDKLGCLVQSDHITNGLQEMEDSLDPDLPRIFFLETTCRSSNNGQVTLLPRQACAIESAAKMNPNSDIFVIFVAQAEVKLMNPKHPNLAKIIQMLLSYPNIKLRHITLERYFNGTVLKKWYETGILNKSSYRAWHLSDVLRLVTLWKYGGTYFDSDFIVQTSFENMPANFAGAESDAQVDNGLMNFETNGYWHDHLTNLLENITKDYKPNGWTTIGPEPLTKLLTKICKTKNTQEMTFNRCANFTVYPPSVFYKIHWSRWQEFFEPNKTKQVLKEVKGSKCVHFWNKLSAEKKLIVGDRTAYTSLAERYCPNVYHNCGQYF